MRAPASIPADVLADFERRLVRGPADACWMMSKFTRSSKGYQRVTLGGREYSAHRIACAIAHGEPKPGEMALHSCNEPSCLNPAHLRWGTAQENYDDAVRSGRMNRIRIERRMSEREARDAITLLAAGYHPADVARAMDISVQSAQRIKARKLFADLDAPEMIDGRTLSGKGARRAWRWRLHKNTGSTALAHAQDEPHARHRGRTAGAATGADNGRA